MKLTFAVLQICSLIFATAFGSSTGSKPFVLRFRTKIGNIVRVEADLNDQLEKAVRTVETDESVHLDCNNVSLDLKQTINQLQLSNGSLISISSSGKSKGGGLKKKEVSKKPHKTGMFQPFPDLAKPDYARLVQKTKARANMKSSMSYSDLTNIASAMHKVEPQKEGNYSKSCISLPLNDPKISHYHG